MLDEIIKASNEALKCIRSAEKHRDFKEVYTQDLDKAEGFLDYLKTESPLLYTVILPEYIKERDHLIKRDHNFFKLYDQED